MSPPDPICSPSTCSTTVKQSLAPLIQPPTDFFNYNRFQRHYATTWFGWNSSFLFRDTALSSSHISPMFLWWPVESLAGFHGVVANCLDQGSNRQPSTGPSSAKLTWPTARKNTNRQLKLNGSLKKNPRHFNMYISHTVHKVSTTVISYSDTLHAWCDHPNYCSTTLIIMWLGSMSNVQNSRQLADVASPQLHLISFFTQHLTCSISNSLIPIMIDAAQNLTHYHF